MSRSMLLLLLVAVLVGVPASACAGDAPVIVRDASLKSYPRVTLELMLPASVAGSDVAFSVEENGRTVEVFERVRSKAKPADVVLLLDSSGSMRGASMTAARSAAEKLVAGLDPASRVAVVAFADRPRLAGELTSQRASTSSAIQSLEAAGETALHDALVMAADIADTGANRPVAVLLSDGGDTVSRADVDAAIKRLRRVRMPVIIVGLPSAEADFGSLRSVAKQTGGRFIPVSSLDELGASFTRIADEVTSSWSVTYVSRRPMTSELEIAVSAKSRDAVASGSFVVRNPSFVPGDRSGRVLEDMAPPNRMLMAATTSLVFASVFGLIAAIGLFIYRPRTGIADMRFYDQLHQADAAGGWASDNVTASVYGAVERVAGRRGLLRAVHEYLEQAGLPLRPTEYITMHLVGVASLGVVAQLLSDNLLVGVTGVLLATFLPMLWLKMRIAARRRRFDEQLPDTLTLLASSLRAGWGLQNAFSLVIEQMPDPIAGEFARASTEIRLGRPVEDALFTIADRLHSVDFKWTATAIAIQKEVGGNLAEVLDNVASAMRDRSSLRRHIAGLVAEGRLSAYILTILPFALGGLLSIVNPEYMREMISTTLGLAMLVAGCFLLTLGAWWLRRSTAIEV